MNVQQIATLLDAEVVCGAHRLDHKLEQAFASDLMSDVLTIKEDNVLLITGLANLQTIRTAEMSDIHCIVFARNKQITPEMKTLAEENDLIVLQCRYSVFRCCGLLYQAGIKPIF